VSVISLDQEPDQLSKNIVETAINQRSPWVDEWVPNFRRLAGFTEKDIPLNTSPDSDLPVNSEPASTRYATSFNVTRNFFYRLLGRVMPALVRYQVLAATRDQDDRDAAQVGAKYLRSRTSADSGEDFEPLVRTVGFLFAGGPAYFNVEPQYSRDGFPGGVRTAAVMPIDVYAFPGIMELNESPAIVFDQRLTRLEIEQRYPKIAAAITATHDESNDSGGWDVIPGAKWPKDVTLDELSPKLSSGVYTLRRLMWRPQNKYPEGREYITIVGSEGIAEVRKKLDTYDGKYPLVTFSDIPMGPFVEDRGRMTISARMQRTLDIALSKTLDLTIGSPQAFVGIPVAGSINPEDITNKAILYYDKIPGQEIDIQPTPGMGNLAEVVELAMRFMAEVHAQHPAARGQAAPRQSGKALEHATQMDVAVDEPFLAMIRRSVARVGKRTLGEAKRTLPDDFNFAALGKYQRHQMESFRKTNLKDGFDVRVMPGGPLPDDKQAKVSLVIKGLGQISLFSDEQEAIRAREILGLHVDGEEVYEIEQEEIQIIRTEDDLIANGDLPPVVWSDNHNLHLVKHKDADIRRRALGPVDAQVAKMAQQHHDEHQAVIDQEMQKQMAMAAAAQQPQPPA
jgi:hypothetical protein